MYIFRTWIINFLDYCKLICNQCNTEHLNVFLTRVYYHSRIDTLSEQIPSKEPSENSTNKEKDDRIEDLTNAVTSCSTHKIDQQETDC